MSTPSAPVLSPSTSPDGWWAAWRARWSYPALVANLVAQIVIIGTGGAVRLTASGLGCSTWPQCEPGHFTPMHVDAATYHTAIEFGNRTITGVLIVISLLVAAVVSTDAGRARSYRLLGLVPLVGVLVQAVIGGIAVLVKLNPAIVASHLLISMALVSVSTVLVRRHGSGDGAPRPVVAPSIVALSRALVVMTAVVLALGVVVTGSGPHSGDTVVGYRFAVNPATMAMVHAGAVWVFLGVLATIVAMIRRQHAPVEVRRAAFVVLAVTLVQGVVGYIQYAAGLPVLLVGVHMVLAALLTVAVSWFVTALRVRD
ncbi:MAG: COX15/CtaA family protein [Cellulomonas sp.]